MMCHSSLSGIFQKDCGQAAMTAIYALSPGLLLYLPLCKEALDALH